jgi:plastocyanin
MAETTPSTNITACIPDSVKVPETKIVTEPDSMVRITVGDKVGWVSSYHLIVPKENQLIKAWLAAHSKS